MAKLKIQAADLFCGAGGTSTGLRLACESAGVDLKLIAVNHWDIAITTHTENHPDADHLCASLDSVDPRKLVPGGRLGLLVASPECTHHSIARGGKPINDQSRASAWRIVEWCSQIRVDHILIENVKEFRTWGPLGTNGRPLKRRKGETYFAFLNALRALGYTVEDRTLNAADYGDPTSRERLFIQAKLGRKPIKWPEASHAPVARPKANGNGNGHLFEMSHTRKPYRTAREIIDWSLPGESIFTRKRPLKQNTLNRIYRGLEKFAGIPFIVPQEGDDRVRSIDRPLQVIKTQSRGIGLVQPFIIQMDHSQSETSGRDIDRPMPVITSADAFGLVQPFIVELRGGQDARSLDKPLSTITTKGMHHALCEPFVMVNRSNNVPKSINDPLPPLCTADHMAVVQPFLIPFFGERQGQKPRVHSVDEPLPAVTGQGAGALVQPFIIPTNHGQDGRSHDINRPMPTITSVDAWALIEPFLVKYNGTGGAMPVTEPLDTVTAKDRFGLVEPELTEGQPVAVLDIRFRMLQPHELAAAMSFPKSYIFKGNREQKVKQIGNAVPVNLAKALCSAILESM